MYAAHTIQRSERYVTKHGTVEDAQCMQSCAQYGVQHDYVYQQSVQYA